MKAEKRESEPMEMIGLRVPKSFVEILDSRAEARKLTRSGYVRMLVLNDGVDAHHAEVTQSLADLKGLLQEQPYDLATLAVGILMKLGVSEEEATKWATRKLIQ